jgi:hypothetical protein
MPHRKGRTKFLKNKRMKNVPIHTKETTTTQEIVLRDLKFILMIMFTV